MRTKSSFRPRLEVLENRLVPTGATYGFDDVTHTFNYDATAETAASTLHISRDDNLFTFTYQQGLFFISIYDNNINQENITLGGYADTIYDSGTNIGYSNFFTATYDLGTSAAVVDFSWAAGFFGCSHCGITGGVGATVSFAVTDMPSSSLIGVQIYNGAGSSFTFTQSGDALGRGLNVSVVNQGAGASSDVSALADSNTSVTLLTQNTVTGTSSTTNLTIAAGFTGFLTYETDGYTGGGSALVANITDLGSHGSHLGTVKKYAGDSVTNTSNVDVVNY